MADVFFTDFRTHIGTPLPEQLKKLCRAAGIGTIDMEGQFVAIKMHFGELGNIAYLRPQYAKAVADLVKEQKGIPFLTDCNTLYPGSRRSAPEHMDCANINGFNTVTTGCQVIIGDGLKGTDDVLVPVRNGEYCKEAYIGRAVMDADIFISLTHFKGHEATGFGGTLKNIGMGCGSRAGKMQQHNSGESEHHLQYSPFAPRSADPTRSATKAERHGSILTSARGAGAASEHVPSMRFRMTTVMPTRSSAARLQSIRRQSVTEDPASIFL